MRTKHPHRGRSPEQVAARFRYSATFGHYMPPRRGILPLLDVDGLPELAQVGRTGIREGDWWDYPYGLHCRSRHALVAPWYDVSAWRWLPPWEMSPSGHERYERWLRTTRDGYLSLIAEALRRAEQTDT